MKYRASTNQSTGGSGAAAERQNPANQRGQGNIFSVLCPHAFVRVTMLAYVCALGLVAAPAEATERTWTGAVSRYWSEAGNWNPAGEPQNGDLLDFTQDSPQLSMINDLVGLTVDSLYFNNNYSYQLDGNSLAFTSPTRAFSIGVSSGGSSAITINCPLTFVNGSIVYVLPGLTGFSDNQVYVYLNGSISVQSGSVIVEAASLYVAPFSGTSHLYISGPLAGAGDIIVTAFDSGNGNGSVEFDSQSDSPDFTGVLWLSTTDDNGSKSDYLDPIIFNQSYGVTVANTVGIRNGDTAYLQIGRSDQSGTTLDIESGGQLYSSGNANFNRIVMRNFSADSQSSVLNTESNVFFLNNGIAVRCDNNDHAPIIQGQLYMLGSETLDVHGTASIGLQIDANIGGVGFNKIGNSTLILDGNNSFSGTVEEDEGILDVRNSNALGSTGATNTLNGGSLTLRDSISGIRLIAGGESTNGTAADLPGATLVALSANPVVWSGPVVLDTNLDVFGQDVTFSGSVSGAGGLGFFNLGTAQITGSSPNSFTGTLLARCPLLELNMPSNTKACAGPLVVGGGLGGPYEVRWLQSEEDNYGDATLYANGVINLNNNYENLYHVTFNGGTIETGSGTVALIQPLVVNSNSATAVINGNLLLPYNPNNTTYDFFNVADGPAEPDLLINAAVSGSPDYVVKQGAGTMALAGPNTYLAIILLQEGTLEAENASALGSVGGGSGCIVYDGATLALNNSGTTPNNLEVRGAGVGGNGAIQAVNGSIGLSGPIQLDGATLLNVASTASLGIDGVISGTGPLTKTGAGSLGLGGTSTYSGDTTDQSGLLYLSAASAVPGNLVLGPAPANAAALAIFLSSDSIGGGAVTVNANSSLGLNGRNQTLSQLTLNDGGSLTTGSGSLLLTPGATVNVGSENGKGSHVSASIQGNVGLAPSADSGAATFNVSPYAIFYPFDSRPELDVAAAVFVNGHEPPGSPNSGITKNGGGRMRLGGSDSFKGNSLINGGTLQVDGTVQGYLILNALAVLKGSGTAGIVDLNSASAMVSPGDSPGILTCGYFDLGGGSGILNVALNGTTPGSQYDQLQVSYDVDLTGVTLTGTLGYTPSPGDQFTIIANNSANPVTGIFNGLPEGAALALGGQVFHITYQGGDGNDVVLTDTGKLVIPQLSIERVGTNLVRLLWPTNALGFTLQSVTNLPATNWTSVPPSPVVIGTNNVVTNSATGDGRFYRLMNP